MRQKTIIICLGCLVGLLLLSVAYLYSSSKKKENLQAVENLQQVIQALAKDQPPPQPKPVESSPCLVLFYATWCGHCQQMKPEWEKTKQFLTEKGLKVHEIESKDPAMAAHTIKGFPTIRFFPEGPANTEKYIEYTGARTMEGILQFLSPQ